jgi:hypothetical protein
MVRLKAGQKPRHRPRSQGQSPNSPPRRPAPAAFPASTQVSRPPPGPTTSASKTKRSPFNVRPSSHCRAGPRGHASRRTPDATAQPRHGRKGQPYNRSPPSFVIRHSSFVIRHSSFVIRHSSFVIRHSSFVIRHSSFVIRHSSFVIPRPLRGRGWFWGR